MDKYLEVGGLRYDKPTFLEALRNEATKQEYANYARDVLGFDGDSLLNVMKMIDDRGNEIGTTNNYKMSPMGTMPRVYYGGATGKTLVRVKGKNGYYYNNAQDAADLYINYVLSKLKPVTPEEPIYLAYPQAGPKTITKAEAEKLKKELEEKLKTASGEEVAELQKLIEELTKKLQEKETSAVTEGPYSGGISGEAFYYPFFFSEDNLPETFDMTYAPKANEYRDKLSKTYLSKASGAALESDEAERLGGILVSNNNNDVRNEYLKVISKILNSINTTGGLDQNSISGRDNDVVLNFTFDKKNFKDSEIPNEHFPGDYIYEVPAQMLDPTNRMNYFVLPGLLAKGRDNNSRSLLTVSWGNENGKPRGIYQMKSIDDIIKDLTATDLTTATNFLNFVKGYTYAPIVKAKETPVVTDPPTAAQDSSKAVSLKKGGRILKMSWGASLPDDISMYNATGEKAEAKKYGISLEGAHDRHRRLNPNKETLYNEAGWEWRDVTRLVGTIADLASMVTNASVAGVEVAPFIGLAGTGLSSVADWTDDSVGFMEALTGTGLGLATDVASIIPEVGAYAKSAKVVKDLAKLAPLLGGAFAAAGMWEAKDALGRVISGEDFTAEDLRQLLVGAQAVAGTYLGVKNLRKTFTDTPKGFKEAEDKIAVEVLDKTTNKPKNLIFEGEDAAKIKQAHSDGKLNDEIANLTYNKNYEVRTPSQGFSKAANLTTYDEKTIKGKLKKAFAPNEVEVPFKRVLTGPNGEVIVKGRDSRLPWRNTSDASYQVTKDANDNITDITKKELQAAKPKRPKTTTPTKPDLDLDFSKVRAEAKKLYEEPVKEAKLAVKDYNKLKEATENPFISDKKISLGGKEYDYNQAINVTHLSSGTDGKEVAKELSKVLAQQAVNKAEKVIKNNSLSVTINGKDYAIDQSYVKSYDPKDLLKELEIKRTGGLIDFNKMIKFVNKYGK